MQVQATLEIDNHSSSSNSINKKATDNAGALVCWTIMQIRSVPGWATITITAKFVADAASDHADIRPGVGGEGADCEVRRQERTAVALPEEIIVFDAGGPIRGETVVPVANQIRTYW